MGTNHSSFRRTKCTAAVVGAVIVGVFVASGPSSAAPEAAAPFSNGTGNATALGYKVNPTNGNLSFGVTVGESIAGHQNTAATGQSRAINLGVIGVTLAGTACDGGDPTWEESSQPQPVIARSDDQAAADGITEAEQGLPGGIEKFARANPTPYAEAITTIAPMGDPKTVFINGGRTISKSGVVNGNTREAVARTELGTVSLGGGAVKLNGLVWEATNRSGAVEESIGSFTLGSIELAGQKVSLPGDGADQLTALNAMLKPLGFDITPPKVRDQQGVEFVDPLVIGIIPSTQRDGLIAPVVSQLQPLREQIADALLAQDCGNSTYITIADIVLGSVTGAGSLRLELGGVQATTADFTAFQFGAFSSLPPLDSSQLALLPGTPGIEGTLGAPGTPALPAGEAAAVDEGRPAIAQPIANLAGSRGGWLTAIGGIGLALLLGTAEADRRKMHHALIATALEA